MTYLNQLTADITNFKEKYKLNTFVETGCYKGESLSYVHNLNFKKLYSCDINQECVDNCQKLFPDASIHNMDSISFFKQILPTISGNSMFWLDAHFPAFYGLDETPETKFPLIEELLLIKQLKQNYQNDVILCDDIRVLLPDNNPHHHPYVWEMFKLNHTLQELTSILEDTHNFTTSHVGEGVLIFTPK